MKHSDNSHLPHGPLYPPSTLSLDSEENLLLPIDWCKHEYDTVEFEMRGQVLNKKLEKMADEILAGAEESP